MTVDTIIKGHVKPLTINARGALIAGPVVLASSTVCRASIASVSLDESQTVHTELGSRAGDMAVEISVSKVEPN